MNLTRAISTLGVLLMGSAAPAGAASDLGDEELLKKILEKPDDGAPESVERRAEAGHFRILTEQCEIPTELHRDADGRITGLLFQASLTELYASVFAALARR
jgi:hypothetical protein